MKGCRGLIWKRLKVVEHRLLSEIAFTFGNRERIGGSGGCIGQGGAVVHSGHFE